MSCMIEFYELVSILPFMFNMKILSNEQEDILHSTCFIKNFGHFYIVILPLFEPKFESTLIMLQKGEKFSLTL